MNIVALLMRALCFTSLFHNWTCSKVLQKLFFVEALSKRSKCLKLLIMIAASTSYASVVVTNAGEQTASSTQQANSALNPKLATGDLKNLMSLQNYSQNLLKCASDKNGTYWLELHTGNRNNSTIFGLTMINERNGEVILPYSAEAYDSISQQDDEYWKTSVDNFQYKIFSENGLDIDRLEPMEFANKSGIDFHWIDKSISFGLNRNNLKFEVMIFGVMFPSGRNTYSCYVVGKEQAATETKRLIALIRTATQNLNNQISQAKQIVQSKRKI